MNTHTKVTILGMFAGAAIVALASSGACNHSVQVDCATVGSICGGPSPNCTHLEANKYYGRVKAQPKEHEHLLVDRGIWIGLHPLMPAPTCAK